MAHLNRGIVSKVRSFLLEFGENGTEFGHEKALNLVYRLHCKFELIIK